LPINLCDGSLVIIVLYLSTPVLVLHCYIVEIRFMLLDSFHLYTILIVVTLQKNKSVYPCLKSVYFCSAPNIFDL